MQHTENFQLGLWEPSDQVVHQSFNENTEKIEAALTELSSRMPRMAVGTYTGKNKYGSSSPTTVTLPFPPKFIFIWSRVWGYHAQGIQGQPVMCYYDDDCESMTATWSGNSVSFYHSSSSSYQMNRSDETYSYIALG